MCIHIITVSLCKYYISMYALHIYINCLFSYLFIYLFIYLLIYLYIYMCMYVYVSVMCVCVAHMLRQTSMTYFPEM